MNFYLEDVITKAVAPITEQAYMHYISDPAYVHKLRLSRQVVITRLFP